MNFKCYWLEVVDQTVQRVVCRVLVVNQDIEVKAFGLVGVWIASRLRDPNYRGRFEMRVTPEGEGL